LTDSTGTVQTQYTYEPFGNASLVGLNDSNTNQYTARENDGTGLFYYRARFYNPQFQRFITEDPFGFSGGINHYVYAADEPISASDPFGLAPNMDVQAALTNKIQNLFPGSVYDETTGTLIIKQNTDAVQNTLVDQGYQQPGQWWNPFLYWDPVAHAGGWEYRAPTQKISFHFRERYPPCPFGALDPGSCLVFQHTTSGRKTVLDQFHIDPHNPSVDPWGHLIHDFFHIQ